MNYFLNIIVIVCPVAAPIRPREFEVDCGAKFAATMSEVYTLWGSNHANGKCWKKWSEEFSPNLLNVREYVQLHPTLYRIPLANFLCLAHDYNPGKWVIAPRYNFQTSTIFEWLTALAAAMPVVTVAGFTPLQKVSARIYSTSDAVLTVEVDWYNVACMQYYALLSDEGHLKPKS